MERNGLTDYTLDKKTGNVKKVADTKDATDRIVQTRMLGKKSRASRIHLTLLEMPQIWC